MTPEAALAALRADVERAYAHPKPTVWGPGDVTYAARLNRVGGPKLDALRGLLSGVRVTPDGLRAAVAKFLSTSYPNNGEGRVSDLRWTVPETAFGDLRRALDVHREAAPEPDPAARGAMYADMHARLAEKWGTVLEAADRAEDATPEEVIEALRSQSPTHSHLTIGYSEDCRACAALAPRDAAPEDEWGVVPCPKCDRAMWDNHVCPSEASPSAALDAVLTELRDEVGKARAKHAPMHSPHEGWAVIREELDPELWEHVCHDTGRSPEARHEALQVAAMGVRYILDLIDEPPAAEEQGHE